MLRELLKTLFRPSPADRAFKKCMGANRDLGIRRCCFTEQLGGKWRQAANGGYEIVGVGQRKATIDLAADIRRPLSGRPPLTPSAVYERLRDQSGRAN